MQPQTTHPSLPVSSEPAPREEIGAEPASFSPPASEPGLGEVTLEEATPHSLSASLLTATEGEFDSFQGPIHRRGWAPSRSNVESNQHDITISDLNLTRISVSLYGFHDGQRVGPAHIEAVTGEQKSSAHSASFQGAVRAQRRPRPHGLWALPSGPVLSMSVFSPKRGEDDGLQNLSTTQTPSHRGP